METIDGQRTPRIDADVVSLLLADDEAGQKETRHGG